ncbi:alpha/beta hydrolase [Marinospirillum perlucidum]|uniref:alpha/beta hydrolase n=1 Tax=Marinospirillum perlucidum TaxID=1982602 RepID=UPI000DF17A23|nr:alpha/beta hydrolase [Marinospirillum perlucidum]
MVKIFLRSTLVVFLGLSLTACGHLFYWPEKGLRGTPDELNLPYQDVYLQTDRGLQLHGWWLEARLESGQQEEGIIYFLHGNAENISTHFFALNWMTKQGWHLFVLDYRGYGLSEGTPDIQGVHQDAYQGLKWAVQESQRRELPLVVVGQSIGGVTALTLMSLAEEAKQVDALVVDSAFSGYQRIAREKMSESWLLWAFQYPFSWLVTDDYSPERHLGQLPEGLPVLYLHSCADQIIPCSNSQRLYQQTRDPSYYWQDEEARHIQMLRHRNWRSRLLEWLDLQLQ